MLLTLIQLVFIILFIRQIIIFILAWWTGNFSEVPFHATNHFAVHALLQSLKKHAENKPLQFMELGSGSGRVSLSVVKHFPFRVTGIEKNPVLLHIANLKKNISLARTKNVSFLHTSFFDVSFSQTDVMYMYIIPEIIAKLVPKLEKELKSGALLFSWRFPVKSDRFKLIDTFKRHHTMFVYRKR